MLQKKTDLECLHSFPRLPLQKDMLELSEDLYWFPHYLSEVCPFKNQYHFEWRKYLIKKNSETVQKSINSKKRFAFYMPQIVKSIFNICKIFRQPPEVRYLAVDVLDRFLVEHFLKVGETFECRMEDESLDTWQAVVERMLEQSPLRILTSVQLAMKYSWSCNVIRATDIQKIMAFLGHKKYYPKQSILKSEARIYQHLNYNISIKTPFTYLEMFFDDFQKHEFLNITIPLHDLFITCIDVLDIAIIFHKQIYNDLNCTNEKKYCIASLKANFVVLAASVIFASSFLEDPSAVTSKIILQTLCSVGECRKSDIETLGTELLNIIKYNI